MERTMGIEPTSEEYRPLGFPSMCIGQKVIAQAATSKRNATQRLLCSIPSRESNWPDRSRHQRDSRLELTPDQLIQGSQKPGPSQLLRLSARRRFKKIR